MAAVATVALLARVVVAVTSYVVTDGYLIPDEVLYVELARAMVHGQSPNEWYPGYGQSFYESTWTFSAPLAVLFHVFGTARLVGQLFAAVVGAGAAGLTAAVALRFLRPAYAAAAGLVVALSPSEVLFSSVVLREAPVWLGLVLVAMGALFLTSASWRRLAGGAMLAAGGLLALAYLRDQTMLAAAWALIVAALVTPWSRWLPRVAAALAVAAIVPWIAGNGILGWSLVHKAAPDLALTRAKLGAGARSAFGGGIQAPPSTGGQAAPATPTRSGSPGPSAGPSQEAKAAANEDEGVGQDLEHLPTGLVDVTLRPLPWESSIGLSQLLAKLENLLWYVFYALSAVGILASIRRRPARLALQFPVLVMGMLFGIAALTQGNLGTAFRHRDQVLWVLALCAAAGLQWLAIESRWARRRTRSDATAALPPAEQDADAPVAVMSAPAERAR